MANVSNSIVLDGQNLKPKTPSKKKDFEGQMQDQLTFASKIVSSLGSDPMNPMKPQDTMKLFQDITNNQQIMQQTEILEGLSKKADIGHLLNASNLAGKTIEIQDNRFQVSPTSLHYRLPEEVEGAFVDILNPEGQVVRTLQLDPKQPLGTLAFDQHDEQGRRLASGNYHYQVRYMPKGNLEQEMTLEKQAFSVQDQQQLVSYILPKQAKQCTLTLETGTGHVLHRWDGKVEPGKHELDLFESFGAQKVALPDGTYRFRAHAVDLQDKGMDVQTLMTVQVEGVEASKKGPAFRYQGGMTAPFDNYRALREEAQNSAQPRLDAVLHEKLYQKLADL